MRCPQWITASQLDRWAESPQARSVLPVLLRRLVYATVPAEQLLKIDFPGGAETHRSGYDGTTVLAQPRPFVPSGVCFWEISCDSNPGRKAQDDYDKRIHQHRERVSRGETENLKEATYIAVNARDWTGAKMWAEARTTDGHFKAVHAYDSNSLEHWTERAPAVGLWLAQEMGQKCDGVLDLAAHWANLQSTLRRPLPPNVLLVNRGGIEKAFGDWLAGPCRELAVKAASGGELVSAFCAWVQKAQPQHQDEIASRAIIVEERETWRALATSRERLILIASPRLDADPDLFAEATRQGHHVLRFAEFRTPRITLSRKTDGAERVSEQGS